MFLLNGKQLQIDTPFTHNGIQYPANWLRVTTLQEKQAIGIVEVPDPIQYDPRFYYVDSQGVGVPIDLAILKTRFTEAIKAVAGSLLTKTDWYIIRYAETGQAVPTTVSQYRTAVRNYSNTSEASIENATTIEELQQVLNQVNSSWPTGD